MDTRGKTYLMSALYSWYYLALNCMPGIKDGAKGLYEKGEVIITHTKKACRTLDGYVHKVVW